MKYITTLKCFDDCYLLFLVHSSTILHIPSLLYIVYEYVTDAFEIKYFCMYTSHILRHSFTGWSNISTVTNSDKQECHIFVCMYTKYVGKYCPRWPAAPCKCHVDYTDRDIGHVYREIQGVGKWCLFHVSFCQTCQPQHQHIRACQYQLSEKKTPYNWENLHVTNEQCLFQGKAARSASETCWEVYG